MTLTNVFLQDEMSKKTSKIATTKKRSRLCHMRSIDSTWLGNQLHELTINKIVTKIIYNYSDSERLLISNLGLKGTISVSVHQISTKPQLNRDYNVFV